MATNFPTSVDALTNPVSNDSLNSPSHSAQHANANDAIEAIEGYLLTGAGAAGLVFLKAQTIGTTVSSVNVTDAFNATYEDYKIIVTGGVSSASLADLTLKLGATTTGYYSGYVRAVYSSGASSTTSDNNAASFARAGSATLDSLQMSLDLKAPFLAKNTSFANSYVQQSTGGLSGFGAGYLANTTSYTDFTITPSSGTLTGGTIYVYGYKKA